VVRNTPAVGALLQAADLRRVTAHLLRRLGLHQFALVEDAVQSAALRALQRWPHDGTPRQPCAWLYQVAHNEAIDQLRRLGHQQTLDQCAEDLLAEASETDTRGRFVTELDDDELALAFAACHPDLPPSTQVALALRALAALELGAIASLLLSTPAAVAQRLARAREALAGKQLEIPSAEALPPRCEAVLTTLLLMFRAGQQAADRSGDPELRENALALCWESIRLARALCAHPLTHSADTEALAALLLLHGARLSGRTDAQGDFVPLPGQPRARWDGGMIRMGLLHLHRSQSASMLSRWHLLAGIAAEHALAHSYEATRWDSIVRYYDILLRLDGSSAPRLGHAIALAEAGEPAAAYTALEALLPSVPDALRPHTLAALARACERLGDSNAAQAFLTHAIGLVAHPADARLLRERLANLGVPPPDNTLH